MDEWERDFDQMTGEMFSTGKTIHTPQTFSQTVPKPSRMSKRKDNT